MLLRGEHVFEVFVGLENGESPAAGGSGAFCLQL